MITITKDRKDHIIIKGHANFSDSNDIVCASASSIMYTTLNAILNFDEEAIKVEDDGNKVEITIVKDDEITTKLIDNMFLMYESLVSKYPDNIKIK